MGSDRMSALRSEFDRMAASAAEASQGWQAELAEFRAILQSVADWQSSEDANRGLQADELAIVRRDLAALKADLLPLAGSNLAVYLTPELRPAAKPQRGASRHRIVVCSLPKAGTYFLAEVLSQMGCLATQLHLSSDLLTDYRWATHREGAKSTSASMRRWSFQNRCSWSSPASLRSGTWNVRRRAERGSPTSRRCSCTAICGTDWPRFFAFLADTQREGPQTRDWSDLPDGPEKMLGFLDHLGESYFGQCLPMGDWLDQSDVFKLSFETLYGDHGMEAHGNAGSPVRLPGDLRTIGPS